MTSEKQLSLSSKTLNASVWTVTVKMVSRGLDLLTLLVLARYLGPAEFGLIAIAMTIVYVVEAILELPLSAALISADEITEDMYDTAFTLSLLRGLCITCIMGGLSFPLAHFYGDSRLVLLILILSIAPFMRGMINSRLIKFEKMLDYRRDFFLEVSGKIVASLAAMTIALSTSSYWAMVAGTLLSPSVMMVLSYIIVPVRPRFTLSAWPAFSNILGWSILSQVAAAVNWQVDRLILPRFTDIVRFGHFSTANDIASLPLQAIASPVTAPLLPAFAAARAGGTVSGAYMKASRGIMILLAPIFFVMVVRSQDVVLLVLGEKWLPAAPVLSGIAFSNLILLPIIPMPALVMAYGQMKSIALRTTVELIVRIPLTVLGIIYYGVMGAITAKILTCAGIVFLSMGLVKNVIRVQIWKQLLVVLDPALCILGSYGISKIVTASVPDRYRCLEFAGWLACFGACYLALIFLLWSLKGKRAGLENDIRERVSRIFRIAEKDL